MATSVATATLVKRTKTSAELIGIFTVAVAAGDYATGGLAINFAGPGGFTNRKPDFVIMQGISGYFYEYVYTTRKFQVRAQTNGAAAGDPLGELAAAASPAALVADTIRAEVHWLTTPGLPAST